VHSVIVLAAARLADWIVLLFLRPILPLLRSRSALSLLAPKIWDGIWYERAAQYGWPTHFVVQHGVTALNTLAFFPAFPMVIRAVHLVLPVSWQAATTIAELLSQVSLVLAFRALARDVFGEHVARRATVLFCFAPGAFIFALPYSEPTFLTFCILAILALRRRRWVAAGALAAIATLGRPSGVAVVAAAAWAAGWAIWRHRDWKALAAPALAPLGIVAWFGYLWAHTGTPLAWYHEEHYGWGERVSPLAFVHLIHVEQAQHSFFDMPDFSAAVAGTVLAVVLVVVMITVRPPGVLWVFTAVVLILSLFSETLGLRPRFVLTAFPLTMALAARLKREDAYAVAVAVSAVASTGLLVLATYTAAAGGPVMFP
jgi:hypothetical protein